MGLNIIPYKIVGVEKDETWGGREVKYLKTEKFDRFDTCRYSGDREFAQQDFISHPDDGEDFEERYYRPKDFAAMREWIKTTEHIPDCNRGRLLGLMDEMEADSKLYLYFSW